MCFLYSYIQVTMLLKSVYFAADVSYAELAERGTVIPGDPERSICINIVIGDISSLRDN